MNHQSILMHLTELQSRSSTGNLYRRNIIIAFELCLAEHFHLQELCFNSVQVLVSKSKFIRSNVTILQLISFCKWRTSAQTHCWNE